MTSALALLQAAAPAPDPWAMAGRVALILTLAFGGVGLFVWRALLAKVAIVAMDESKDTWQKKVDEHLGPREKATARELERIDTDMDLLRGNDAETVRRLSVLDDQMEGLNAAVLAQGKALMDQFMAAVNRQTAAIEDISRASTDGYREVRTTIEQMRADHVETAKAVSRIEGVISSYDGPERRAPLRPRGAR